MAIYGCLDSSSEAKTWALVRDLCANMSIPILIGGDFNEILSYDEKEGVYTWGHGLTAQTCVRERLNRFVGSHNWCACFLGAVLKHLVHFKSDHTPSLLGFEDYHNRRKKRRKTKKDLNSKWAGCLMKPAKE